MKIPYVYLHVMLNILLLSTVWMIRFRKYPFNNKPFDGLRFIHDDHHLRFWILNAIFIVYTILLALGH